MGDDVGLREALARSEQQAERAEALEEQDPKVIAGVEFIKFVQQDRARRAACLGPPEPPAALPLDSVWPKGSDITK